MRSMVAVGAQRSFAHFLWRKSRGEGKDNVTRIADHIAIRSSKEGGGM